jgi:hypothetical protein
LKFDCACDFTIALGDIEETVGNVICDASGREFIAFPHGSAALLEPARGFGENVGDCLGILRCGLAD